MKDLGRLKIINVSHNVINEVGDCVEGLTTLAAFEGTMNSFSNISTKLGSLCNLHRLSIPNNQIKVSNQHLSWSHTMTKA